MLSTETPSERHPALDEYGTAQLVDALASDHLGAVQAVLAAKADIVRAVERGLPRLQGYGRLVYVGAGTSGRLGLLDSVELLPTFSWPPERARAFIAGGTRALWHAVEGAEDDPERGAADLRALPLAADDVVLLLAASGTTPYVCGALDHARATGALTIGIANNPGTALLAGADVPILLDTGSELISGSTRLKAGTAQKVTLNTLTSAWMVRLHKVYGNLMVDLAPTNRKLYRRAERLTMHATGCSEVEARHALQACGHRVKAAIVTIVRQCDARAAQRLLDDADGDLRRALAGSA
jgi:N-acetylmuramic acid 6-phosphate etherase